MRKLTTEEFIAKARAIHGDKYGYSKVEYIKNTTKVCIICPIHGEFWQTPASHLNGQGCITCLKENRNYILNYDDFIKKANEVHGNTYDYSNVKYVDTTTKVCITCPKHGDFYMTPRSHIHNKCGCPKCKVEKAKLRMSKGNDTFINEAKTIHGDKYDYSQVEYTNANTKVIIICPEHGAFEQIPSAHVNQKQGCPKCGRLEANKSLRLNNETFIAKATAMHNGRYDYSKSEYINYYTPINIICPIHGDFWQTPDSHLQGRGCRMCGVTFSKGENEIRDFLLNNIGQDNFLIGYRKLIAPLEVDFYIPNKQIAIEFNGIKWHSSQYKDKDYHLHKTKGCKEKGVGLIHIFEDEFYNSKDIVLNKLAHIIGLQQDLPKIYGRKVKVHAIDSNVSKAFLSKFHIQGYVSSTIHYGAFYEDKLIAVMSFKINAKGSNDWELTRFASDYNYICCGVGGRLFKHFIKKYNPDSIKSFADRRWTINEDNNIYCQLGFKFDGYTPPDYKYVINGVIKRQHKFNFRKKILLRKYPEELNENMSETEMTEKLGIYKVYDCGLIRYIWKKEN